MWTVLLCAAHDELRFKKGNYVLELNSIKVAVLTLDIKGHPQGVSLPACTRGPVHAAHTHLYTHS